jgi:hypothetical protein
MSGASTLRVKSPAVTRATRRKRGEAGNQRHALKRHGRRPPPAAAGDVLARYTDSRGRPHEIVLRAGAGGSMLVIDDSVTVGDRRLLAHLAPDEPAENARVVCDHYLVDSCNGSD